MENLDNKNQLIAVKKVLEELKKAEKIVKSWNTSWYEQLLNAHCLPLHYEFGEANVWELERKYAPRYKLANAFYSEDSIGIPLTKETLVYKSLYGEKSESLEVEFGRIDWMDMRTHKSTRHFSFYNNGIIEFSKTVNTGKRLTLKNPQKIYYNTSFNVLSDDFDITINLEQLTDAFMKKHKYDDFQLKLNNNILIEKFNDIEIMRDLSTGLRLIRIIKKYDKNSIQNNTSVVFEAILNPNDSLEHGKIVMETHKGNGKINGTYRFDASRKNGIQANFYSRKGKKVDLTKNQSLLKNANELLLPNISEQKFSNNIVQNFANSTQVAILKNLNEKTIKFDSSDFNMEAIKKAEKQVIEIVKNIKGELPLPGLIERIDKCLKLINKKQNQQIDDKNNCNVLKLHMN